MGERRVDSASGNGNMESAPSGDEMNLKREGLHSRASFFI